MLAGHGFSSLATAPGQKSRQFLEHPDGHLERCSRLFTPLFHDRKDRVKGGQIPASGLLDSTPELECLVPFEEMRVLYTIGYPHF